MKDINNMSYDELRNEMVKLGILDEKKDD